MLENVPHEEPSKSQSMYSDPDRAKALALAEQDMVVSCKKQIDDAVAECPNLDSGDDEATVAINDATALLKSMITEQEAESEREALDTLHKTFQGIDLVTGSDLGAGAALRGVGQSVAQEV